MGIEEIRRMKVEANEPKEKKVYRIPKVSPKRVKKETSDKEILESGKVLTSGGAELKRWFEDRRKEMGGKCQHCGSKSCRDSNQYFKFSIAHILPKRLFKSVATHPMNWIELCFWNNSCHTNLDNNTLDIMDLNCFDLVIQRFVAMYPSIDVKERKYIPEVLLQYLEVEK
jgi:hypothetical protein